MKALFIGDYNYLTKAFASKLVKNGVSVAVFNNKKSKEKLSFKYSKYTGGPAAVKGAIENYRPNVMVIASAFDGVTYLDELEASLTNAVKHDVKRVMFLSSTTVYGFAKEDFLPEEADEVNPQTESALLFSAGEDICRRFSAVHGIDLSIIRISAMYGENVHDADLNKMVSGLLEGETMKISPESGYSFIHIDDASEAFMKIFDTSFSDVYNLSSDNVFTALKLKEVLSSAMAGYSDKLLVTSDVKSECYAASPKLLEKQYIWTEHYSVENTIASIVLSEKERMAADKKKKEKKEREIRNEASDKSFFARAFGYIETFLLFLVVFYVTGIQPGIDLLQGIDFIVIYLVLIAITMTLRHSAFSLLLCIFLLVFQRVQLGYDIFSAVINSHTLLVAAEYCIVSVAVSYVVQRLKTKIQLYRLELDEQNREMEQLEQFSDDNLRTRHFFEDQIIGYDLSLPRIVSLTSRLDTLEPERIIPETVNIIHEATGAADVATYFIGEKGGRMRLSYAKTEEAAKLGQSPIIDELPEMMNVLENDRVYINANQNDKLPSMASGVIIDNRLSFVFVIWNMPFAKMRLDMSNLLKSVTLLITAALNRANRYEEATVTKRYFKDTTILRPEFFAELCNTRLTEDGIGGILCRVEAETGNKRAVGETLERLTRENDYIGTDASKNLYVLLAGTNIKGFEIFQKRLLENGIKCSAVEGGI